MCYRHFKGWSTFSTLLNTDQFRFSQEQSSLGIEQTELRQGEMMGTITLQVYCWFKLRHWCTYPLRHLFPPTPQTFLSNLFRNDWSDLDLNNIEHLLWKERKKAGGCVQERSLRATELMAREAKASSPHSAQRKPARTCTSAAPASPCPVLSVLWGEHQMLLRLTQWPKRNGYSTKDQNAQKIGYLKETTA